ncbi:MAG: 4Fe-4S binding protein [Clostridiales bacterium]|nr:4Fe-4S binding protein [Eubacteriales bacterium]MDH7565610.1 4Fe-4S binding protein [Clostridiales bacterium]
MVHKKLCPQNHKCPAVSVCPAGALTQKGYEAPIVDNEKCLACEKCIFVCPMGAIRDE